MQLENRNAALQNIRLMPVEKPRDKENIPLRRIRREPRTPPEIIDLVEESAAKKEDGSSSSKKQKLDILREGGLEVTPVTTNRDEGGPSTVVKPPPPPTSPGKISITVTPDVSHMLSGGATILPATSEVRPKFANFVPPPQSSTPSTNGRSLPPPIKSAFNFSDKTVYGNPKDIFRGNPIKKDIAPFFKNNKNISLIEVHSDMPVKKLHPNLGSEIKFSNAGRSKGNFVSISQPSSSRSNGSCEVLDLTVKSETPISFPKKGSNLEITLIPRPSGSVEKPRNLPVQSMPPFPKASSTASKRSQKPVQLLPAASTSGSRAGQRPPVAEPSVSAFIPGVMNPVLLQALYNGLIPPQLLSQSLFPQANQSMQAYKEMMKNSRNKNAFPPYFQDGSTSITRIGDNSTPTSK